MSYYKRQQGVALLMAMLVVSIATVTAVSLVHDQAFSVRKTSSMKLQSEILMYAMGLEDYARLFLRKDLKESKTDHLQEDWATGIPPLPIKGGFLSGGLADAQAKINLNNLPTDELALKRFTRLCNNLEINPAFIQALMDWVDEDVELRYPDGAEDDYYTGLDVPYRAANHKMVDISELYLVKGLDAKNIELLLPYVTVLPGKTSLNINTMSSEVFKTLGTNMDEEKFEEERETDPFSSVKNMKQRLNLDIEEQGLSVKTNYFEASGQVMFEEKMMTISSLIHRDDNGGTYIAARILGDSY